MSLMSEYINKKLTSAQLENELTSLVRKYNRRVNRPLFIYAAAISKAIPDIVLSMDDYYTISDHLRDVDSNKLDFYIETPGGSGEAAEEIVRFLRRKFETVNFVVSGEAKSAGTIMVLSGDDILMTESGSLGPIDAQVKIGRSTISAHDYEEWVREKRNEANNIGKLNPFDATMVAQISPGELKLVHHSLSMAKDLVVSWLPKYKFKNWDQTATRKLPVTPEMKEQRAQEIAAELTNHSKWRSHGRSIKIDDLQSIGLEIVRLDDDPDLSDIIYRIQVVIRFLFSDTDIYKMFVSEKAKIFKRAVRTQALIRKAVPQQVNSMEIGIKCEKCGKKHKLYAKFIPDPKIDEESKKKGLQPFPKDNKLICKCGFEHNLLGIRNEIEAKAGRKMIP